MLSESHTGTNISTMKQETEPIGRPSKKQEVANMNDVLAQMRRSGRIHFSKSLGPETATQTRKTEKSALLALPTPFVQENCDKIEEWVILRAQLSCEKTSRPWLVRLNVSKPTKVCIGLGWHSFVADNRLKKGDSLIFLLKEDRRSEFEVHMFRGPQGSPYFPDEGENSSSNGEEEHFSASEEDIKQSHSLSPWHDHVELNKALPRTEHLEKYRTYPGFHKRLTATSITQSDGVSGSGKFEFPRGFIKAHGNQIQGSVKLQGIYEDSPTYLVTSRRRPQHCLRVNILPKDWTKFVKENGLKKGHELQFSLIDESYFVVRKV